MRGIEKSHFFPLTITINTFTNRPQWMGRWKACLSILTLTSETNTHFFQVWNWNCIPAVIVSTCWTGRRLQVCIRLWCSFLFFPLTTFPVVNLHLSVVISTTNHTTTTPITRFVRRIRSLRMQTQRGRRGCDARKSGSRRWRVFPLIFLNLLCNLFFVLFTHCHNFIQAKLVLLSRHVCSCSGLLCLKKNAIQQFKKKHRTINFRVRFVFKRKNECSILVTDFSGELMTSKILQSHKSVWTISKSE